MEIICSDPYTLLDFTISILSGAAFMVGALAVLGLAFLLNNGSSK